MPQYATLSEAQAYFETRLHSGLWDETPLQDRTKALITATRYIDRLSFAGEKNAAYLYRQSLGVTCFTAAQEKEIAEAGLTQELEFPRGSDTAIPEALKLACCELAFELLTGRDAQKELENLSIVSEGFSSVRTTRDRSFVHDHLNAGIVSKLAWDYLLPYIRDSRDVKISRVS